MNYANEPLTESGEDISAKTVHELVGKYESVVYDYLAIMNSSETVKSMESAKYTVQLGLAAITHIYKLAFCTTKNVATAAEHCQKGIYCFIEYIEQTYKLGYINHTGTMQFDYMDAVTFIYDKTMPDLTLDERTGSSAFTNMVTASHMTDFLQCKSALEQFGRVASVLMWFGHSTIGLTDQMEIVDSHLIDFLHYSFSHSPTKLPLSNNHSIPERKMSVGITHSLHLFSFKTPPSGEECAADYESLMRNGVNKDLFLFIETLQESLPGMNKAEYHEFLVALKKRIKKQEKAGVDTVSVLSACLHLKTMNECGGSPKCKPGDLAKLAF